MTPRDDVVLSFSYLADGQVATSQTCPKCKGGRSSERSLSVGVTDGLLWWRCHRASCGLKGSERVGVQGDGGPRTHDENRGRYRSFSRHGIPAALKQTLAERFSIDDETMAKAGWSYTPDLGDGLGARVIMPLYGPTGRVRGESYRSYTTPPHKMKAIINGLMDENQISWYQWRKYGKLLVVVEDIPSAVRLAHNGVNALALCGTTLNLERALEIRSTEYNSIWLCLDGDAFGQAMTYMKNYSRVLPQMKIKFLGDDDVKDMSDDQFDLFLYDLY